MTLALALLLPAASASAWTREAAPVLNPSSIQPESAMTVLPDGSVRYLALGSGSGPYTNQLVVRPPSGPAAFASPFPAAFGQYSSFSFLSLSPADASGSQLALRGTSPTGVSYLPPGANPAAAVIEPTEQVTQIDLAPSGEAAAIVSGGSTAFVRFRPAGAAGRFDTPRELDRVSNMRSYGIGITIDPDGGVFVVYRTEQEQAVLQTYAPPGGNFGPPQLLDIAKADIETVRFGQSTNGHGVLVWDEDTGGDTNSEKLWAVSRAPGGLLGGKSLVATARPGGLVSSQTPAVTDDGTNYVPYLDAGPIVCPNNYREGGSVLAMRGAGGADWAKLNTPTSGLQRSVIEAISTAGNAVGVLTLRTVDPSNVCTDSDPSSALEVQRGQGSSLGGAETVASESITNGKFSTIVRARGFAVNASGTAALLVSEPVDPSNNSIPYLYHQTGAPTPPSSPSPIPVGPVKKPLPVPGKIVISGKKLVARGGEIPFEASCTRLPGEGSKLFCSISAILLEQEKRKGKGKASTARTSAAKGKKAAKPKVLATAKPVKVPVGKTGTIALKLNKLGKQELAGARKAGLPVTLKVTINRKGFAANTIERKLKLVAAKAKGKGKKGGKGGK